MKFGVINSFLIVCFYNGFESCQVGEYLQNSCKKYYIMAINQHLWNIALNLQSLQEKMLPIIFRTIRLTKHLVDRVLADYIDYYVQGSSKLDKYGFSPLPA